jgi:hypothetical protein
LLSPLLSAALGRAGNARTCLVLAGVAVICGTIASLRLRGAGGQLAAL